MAHNHPNTGGLLARQTELIQRNVACLEQALRMLEEIDDRAFAEPPPQLTSMKVSSQLRHVLEYYECFLDQVETLHIDYDKRKRDEFLERSRAAAIARVRSTIAGLRESPILRGDSLLFVRIEDAGAREWRDPFVASSVARELLTLSSHATHHLALVAVILRAWNAPVAADLGVAPSTLRHREGRRLTPAPAEAA